jgi:hypothetical protein
MQYNLKPKRLEEHLRRNSMTDVVIDERKIFVRISKHKVVRMRTDSGLELLLRFCGAGDGAKTSVKYTDQLKQRLVTE